MSLASYRAPYLLRHRRLLLLGAATLVLHYLALDWAGEYLGRAKPDAAPAAAVITAQLRQDVPPPVLAAALAAPRAKAPAPARTPAPVPTLARPHRQPAANSTPASALLAPVSSERSAGPDAAQLVAETVASSAPVVAVATTAQTGALAESAAVTTATTAAPATAPSDQPRYQVSLPPSASFELSVARLDADGTRWTGSAVMSWQTDGSHYQATAEAGISLLITRLNALTLRSVGSIDDAGIAPDSATQQRGRRAATATHFNRAAGSITFSASERSYPLLAGAQDIATLPFQLAAIGRADSQQLAGDLAIQVGDDREASIFRFQLVGIETLETRLGPLLTWHLSRPPRPGSYSSRLDVWLAPQWQWHPVQLRNTEASGALTTQTVTHITYTDTGK